MKHARSGNGNDQLISSWCGAQRFVLWFDNHHKNMVDWWWQIPAWREWLGKSPWQQKEQLTAVRLSLLNKIVLAHRILLPVWRLTMAEYWVNVSVSVKVGQGWYMYVMIVHIYWEAVYMFSLVTTAITFLQFPYWSDNENYISTYIYIYIISLCFK